MSVRSRWIYIATTQEQQSQHRYKIGIMNELNQRVNAPASSFPPPKKTDIQYLITKLMRTCPEDKVNEIRGYIIDHFGPYKIRNKVAGDPDQWYELEYSKLLILFEQFTANKLISKYIIEKTKTNHNKIHVNNSKKSKLKVKIQTSQSDDPLNSSSHELKVADLDDLSELREFKPSNDVKAVKAPKSSKVSVKKVKDSKHVKKSTKIPKVSKIAFPKVIGSTLNSSAPTLNSSVPTTSLKLPEAYNTDSSNSYSSYSVKESKPIKKSKHAKTKAKAKAKAANPSSSSSQSSEYLNKYRRNYKYNDESEPISSKKGMQRRSNNRNDVRQPTNSKRNRYQHEKDYNRYEHMMPHPTSNRARNAHAYMNDKQPIQESYPTHNTHYSTSNHEQRQYPMVNGDKRQYPPYAEPSSPSTRPIQQMNEAQDDYDYSSSSI